MNDIPNKYKELLKEYLSFKTISTDLVYTSECKRCSLWLQKIFEENNFTTKIIPGKKTNPLVFSHYEVNPNFETVLIYGHYDVQPAEKKDGWNTDPFELQEDEEKIYGRWVMDNKWQNFIHIFSIIELIKKWELQYNVKFLLEGNEETENSELGIFVEKNTELLQCNYVLVSDGELSNFHPTIDISLRGGANLKILLTTAKNNLHSGVYGGIAYNPVHILMDLHKKIETDFTEIYENIPEELLEKNSEAFDPQEIKNTIGAKKIKKPKYNYHADSGLLPTIECSGIQSGYIEEGFSNIIPGSAEIRYNIRIAPGQDEKKILTHFQKFIEDFLEPYGTYTVESGEEIAKSFLCDPKKKIFQDIQKILENIYKKDVVFHSCGGGIPIMSTFQDFLTPEVISVSLANPDANMHGVNENFSKKCISYGLQFSKDFFSKKK